MPRIGNFASDVANAIGGIAKGKSEEEDKNYAKGLRAKQDQREQDKLTLEQTNAERAASSEATRLELMRKEAESAEGSRQLQADAFQFGKDKDAREQSERATRKLGLSDRLKQLSPGVKGSEDMSPEDLDAEIRSQETRAQHLEDVKAAHDYDRVKQQQVLNQQVNQARNKMNMSQRALQQFTKQASMTKAWGQTFTMKGLEQVQEQKKIIDAVAGIPINQQFEKDSQEYDQVYAMLRAVGGSGLSPLADQAARANMAFGARTADEQAQAITDLQGKLKSGAPVDFDKLRSYGIPVDAAAAQIGLSVDPTGKVQPMASVAPSAAPAADNGLTSALGAGGGLGDALSSFGAKPNAASFSSGTPPTPVVNGGEGGGMDISAMNALASPPKPPMSAPNIPQSARPPEQFSGHGATGSFSGPPVAQTGTLTTPVTHGDDSLSLRYSRNLPEAETAARMLLSKGMDYNSIIDTAPQQFRSMLAAKLQKRIPTQPLPASPMPSAGAQIRPPATSNPFTPPSSNVPMFTPPTY